MSALYVIPMAEYDHSVLHSVGNDVGGLASRMRAAGIFCFIHKGPVVWCDCKPCVRLAAMASLRLAEHEGRTESVNFLREFLMKPTNDWPPTLGVLADPRPHPLSPTGRLNDYVRA